LKPKKIAFFLNEFPTLTETFILNQIVFLISQGIEVHIISLHKGNFDKLHSQYLGFGLEKKVTFIASLPESPYQRLKEVIFFLKKEGLKKNLFVLFKFLNPFEFGMSGLKLSYFLYYTRMFFVKDFDLIHVHFGNLGVFLERIISKNLLGKVPYLVSFHGYDLVPNQKDKNRKRYSKMLLSSKLFTVNSNYTRSLLEEVDSTINDRIKLLPESLDTSLFDFSNETTTNEEKSIFRLVYVGRLVGWKGADTAIDIVENLRAKYGLNNIELTIIGKGPLQSELEKKVIQKGLTDCVKLLGGQDQSTIKSILGQSDLFLYTGRKDLITERAENQGLVLMEAQAMGLPVVAFDVGGISEGIINGDTGVLVPSEDIEAFSNSVFSLFMDKPKRLSMGIAARQFVKKRFDQKVLGNQLLEIYQEVLK
jgi:colanic acid/amylovoran biosynthesis glycosyltransferase